MSINAMGEGFRVAKTAETLANTLRGSIIRGDLKEGDALPSEMVLTESFRVSRPTLREAFRILESERLIEVRRGARGGPRVRFPDPQVIATNAGLLLQANKVTLQDVFDARVSIEGPAAAIVAATATAEAVARLRANVREASELLAESGPNAEGLSNLSQDFHVLLVELAGNRTLHLFSVMLRGIVDRANHSVVDAQESDAERTKAYRLTFRSHTKLIELIEAGDVDGADDVWNRHLASCNLRLSGGTPAAGTVLDLLG
jgi:DNA-binding FadR family transcriptional regulator